MSRFPHLRRHASLAGPAFTRCADTPTKLLDSDQIATLYVLSRCDPVRALNPLHKATAGGGCTEPTQYADLMLLYAETLTAAGDLRQARRAAHHAYMAAIAPGVTDHRNRVLATFALTGDLCLRTDDTHAIQVCRRYRSLMRDDLEYPEHSALARILFAVAVYRVSCLAAIGVFRRLADNSFLLSTDQRAVVIAGLTAIEHQCAARWNIPVGRAAVISRDGPAQSPHPAGAARGGPTPLPVGVRALRERRWDPRYASDLVWACSGVHECTAVDASLAVRGEDTR